MAAGPRYSDILADILERKHSRCICPTEYLTSLKVPKGKTNERGCQFGPDCQFSASCKYNQAKCTCVPRCLCAPESQQPVPARHKDTTGGCDKANCICVGNCLCKSDESLLNRGSFYRPPTNCDKVKCTCGVCLCRPDELPPTFLTGYFRNTVKKEAQKVMSDETMKQECAEIKQLLSEHEENKNKELDKSRPKTSAEKDTKKMPLQKAVSIGVENDPQKPPLPIKEGERMSNANNNAPEGLKLSTGNSGKSILKPISAISEPKSQKTKKEDKRRKEKSVKQKQPKVVSSANTKSLTQFSCKSSIKKKAPRIRYYYSGGTEHYGVKLGHKYCLERGPLVPKHMGWLWNIEDPSKGIRERKGWPPGFIGKSIKNMIKVMKRVVEADGTLGELKSELGPRRGWKTQAYNEEETEPKPEPPLLHIHKKGKTYNITFCPKNSDEDVGPIPIPFTITEKERDSDSETSDSTLEFELHSPKPRLKRIPQLVRKPEKECEEAPEIISEEVLITPPPPPPPSNKPKKKINKKSRGSEENKILWEEQQTQIQNIA